MAFPDHKSALEEIAKAHREQEKEEPLLLAIYYNDAEHPDFDNMLEVYDGYDRNRVNPDKQMLTTAFGTAASGFAVTQDVSLRLIVTNPVELGRALEEDWDAIHQIREAIHSKLYEAVLTDQSRGAQLIGLLTNGKAVA